MEAQTIEEEAIDIESRDRIRPMMIAEEATMALIGKVSHTKVETIADTRVRMIIEEMLNDRIEAIIRIRDQAPNKATTRRRNITIERGQAVDNMRIRSRELNRATIRRRNIMIIKVAIRVDTTKVVVDTRVDHNQAIKEVPAEGIKAAKAIEIKEDIKAAKVIETKEGTKAVKVKEVTIRRKIMMRTPREVATKRKRQKKANPEEMMCIKVILGRVTRRNRTEGNTIIIRSTNKIVAGARRLSMFQRISRETCLGECMNNSMTCNSIVSLLYEWATPFCVIFFLL